MTCIILLTEIGDNLSWLKNDLTHYISQCICVCMYLWLGERLYILFYLFITFIHSQFFPLLLNAFSWVFNTHNKIDRVREWKRNHRTSIIWLGMKIKIFCSIFFILLAATNARVLQITKADVRLCTEILCVKIAEASFGKILCFTFAYKEAPKPFASFILPLIIYSHFYELFYVKLKLFSSSRSVFANLGVRFCMIMINSILNL